MGIDRVGVLGCGLMGAGIAQVCAQAGHDTIVLEASTELLTRGLDRIGKFLQGSVDRGKMTAQERAATLSRLKGTVTTSDLADRDLVIEAVTEDLAAKQALIAMVDAVCPPKTIFASNTSSLSITQLAAGTRRTGRFIGLHFFNPVPLMGLVEMAPTILTEDTVLKEAAAFVESLNKTLIRTTDRTGFIVNRLLVPYILDAVRALEQGAGSIADIDRAMMLGCGHPMGPLALLDLVGLDTTLRIAEVFFEEFREPRFATPPLLKRMVLAGFHGRKTGRGFYDYGSGNPVPNDFLTRSA
jgi:3-hydroxybutyryl-CoA dehydrogenase